MVYTNRSELDRLETALEAAGFAWWWIELPAGGIFFSPNRTRMIGREKENFFHYTDFIKLAHEDDQANILQAINDHIEGKTDQYQSVYRMKTADGEERTFYDKGRIVARKANGEMELGGIVMDVTDVNWTNVARMGRRTVKPKRTVKKLKAA